MRPISPVSPRINSMSINGKSSSLEPKSSWASLMVNFGRYWWAEYKAQLQYMISIVRAAPARLMVKSGQLWEVDEANLVFYHVKPFTYPPSPPTFIDGDRFLIERYPACPSGNAMPKRDCHNFADIITIDSTRAIVPIRYLLGWGTHLVSPGPRPGACN